LSIPGGNFENLPWHHCPSCWHTYFSLHSARGCRMRCPIGIRLAVCKLCCNAGMLVLFHQKPGKINGLVHHFMDNAVITLVVCCMFYELLTACTLPVVSCSQALSTVVTLPCFMHMGPRACPIRLSGSLVFPFHTKGRGLEHGHRVACRLGIQLFSHDINYQSKTCDLSTLAISIFTVFQLMTQDNSRSVHSLCIKFTLHSN